MNMYHNLSAHRTSGLRAENFAERIARGTGLSVPGWKTSGKLPKAWLTDEEGTQRDEGKQKP